MFSIYVPHNSGSLEFLIVFHMANRYFYQSMSLDCKECVILSLICTLSGNVISGDVNGNMNLTSHVIVDLILKLWNTLKMFDLSVILL